MTEFTLKEHVQPGRLVEFQYYKNNELWYRTDLGFLFPVPISDIGEATFHATDRAILFMRYIRKYMDVLKAAS